MTLLLSVLVVSRMMKPSYNALPYEEEDLKGEELVLKIGFHKFRINS